MALSDYIGRKAWWKAWQVVILCTRRPHRQTRPTSAIAGARSQYTEWGKRRVKQMSTYKHLASRTDSGDTKCQVDPRAIMNIGSEAEMGPARHKAQEKRMWKQERTRIRDPASKMKGDVKGESMWRCRNRAQPVGSPQPCGCLFEGVSTWTIARRRLVSFLPSSCFTPFHILLYTECDDYLCWPGMISSFFRFEKIDHKQEERTSRTKKTSGLKRYSRR